MYFPTFHSSDCNFLISCLCCETVNRTAGCKQVSESAFLYPYSCIQQRKQVFTTSEKFRNKFLGFVTMINVKVSWVHMCTYVCMYKSCEDDVVTSPLVRDVTKYHIYRQSMGKKVSSSRSDKSGWVAERVVQFNILERPELLIGRREDGEMRKTNSPQK